VSKGLLIGMTGYAQAGKDSLADCLAHNHGYVKVGFSDALWNMALEINPWLIVYGCIPVRLKWIAYRYDYTDCKKFPAVRKYLQWLGEMVRNVLGEDTWINTLMRRVEEIREGGRNCIITNVRYENEGIAVQDSGGQIILVEREGVGPVNNHISDAGLCFPMAVAVVHNNWGFEELEQQSEQVHQLMMNMRWIDQQQALYPALKIYKGDEEPCTSPT
jgi:hypothetical protein